MANDLQDQLKKAISQISYDQYEGNVQSCIITYITTKGEVKNILCCDMGAMLAILGAVELSKQIVLDGIKIASQHNIMKGKENG